MIFNYLTTNKITKKRYIGSHDGDFLDGYLGSGNLIKSAIKKYGRENFQRDVLNVVPTREEAFKNEKFLIEMYKTSVLDGGYNLSLTGGIGVPGCFSEETLQKMRESHMGQVSWSKGLTKETNKSLMKISQALLGEKNRMYGKRGKETYMYGKKHIKESKDRMSEALIGRVAWSKGLTMETDERLKNISGAKNPMSKSVLQFSLSGDYIKEWECIADATRAMGCCRTAISICVNNVQRTAGGYIWILKEKGTKLDVVCRNIKRIIKERDEREHPMSKIILQYTSTGEFLKKWEGASVIYRTLGFGRSYINACARGKHPTAYGFIWMYGGDEVEDKDVLKKVERIVEKEKKKRPSRSKFVSQYSLTGNYIKDWDCVADAGRALGTSLGNIGACARGERNKAGGFIWEYKKTENKKTT